MNAIEFVKNFGIEYAIKILNYDPSILDDVCHLDFGETENLKQIVDAWELVEAWGGIDRTKDRIEWAIVNKNYYAADMMKHSINLVEQCS